MVARLVLLGLTFFKELCFLVLDMILVTKGTCPIRFWNIVKEHCLVGEPPSTTRQVFDSALPAQFSILQMCIGFKGQERYHRDFWLYYSDFSAMNHSLSFQSYRSRGSKINLAITLYDITSTSLAVWQNAWYWLTLGKSIPILP